MVKKEVEIAKLLTLLRNGGEHKLASKIEVLLKSGRSRKILMQMLSQRGWFKKLHQTEVKKTSNKE